MISFHCIHFSYISFCSILFIIALTFEFIFFFKSCFFFLNLKLEKIGFTKLYFVFQFFVNFLFLSFLTAKQISYILLFWFKIELVFVDTNLEKHVLRSIEYECLTVYKFVCLFFALNFLVVFIVFIFLKKRKKIQKFWVPCTFHTGVNMAENQRICKIRKEKKTLATNDQE